MPLQHQAFEASLYATGLTNETLTESLRTWGVQSACALQGLKLQGRNVLKAGAEQGEDASYWSTVSAYKCSNIMSEELAGRETAKDHIATVYETRHREEFQVEVSAMFREISMPFSGSSAFLSLCSVLQLKAVLLFSPILHFFGCYTHSRGTLPVNKINLLKLLYPGNLSTPWCHSLLMVMLSRWMKLH